MLTPYVALMAFGAGVLVSNIVWNTVFMRVGGVTMAATSAGARSCTLSGFWADSSGWSR